MIFISLFAVLTATLLALILRRRYASFWAQNAGDYADARPWFDIREELNGTLLCNGVIYGPMGRVKAGFVAKMEASWEGDVAHISEDFTYEHGGTLSRRWTITMREDGRFTATAPDLVGEGQGLQSGSAVRLFYRLHLAEDAGGHVLNVTDWMYLLSDGTIMNRSEMRKFGIKVGELIATMRKAPVGA